jgi:hypothetical protein
MPGRLPINKPLAQVALYYWQWAWIQADRDYAIEEAAIAPDADAVASGSFYAGIFLCQGGPALTGNFGTKHSAAPAQPAWGARGDQLLGDITDPQGLGLNLVSVQTLASINNDWRIDGKMPILKKNGYLLMVYYNTTPANAGTILFSVNGHPVA